MGFSESLGSRQQPTGPNARKVAKFEPGVGSPESEPTSIIFNGLSSAAWANFPPHGLENPPFLAENAKFIKDLWSAEWPRRLTKCLEFKVCAKKTGAVL